LPHRPVKVPIAALLAAFAAGTALLQVCPRLPPLPGALLVAAAGLTAAPLWLGVLAQSRTSRPAPGLPAIALAATGAAIVAAGLAGFAHAGWRAQLRMADELPPAWEERDVRMTGIVDDLPQTWPGGVRFAFAIERTETPGAVVPQRVSLGWFAPRQSGAEDAPVAPVVHAGERWSLGVRLKRPHGNVNPDGFDLEAWLLERNLRATGYVRDSPANARIAPFAGRFGDHVQRARERVRERIARALPDAPYAGVITALAIGDQRAVPERQWTVFNRTGVTHLVSISGLHVTVFAALAGGCAFLALRRSTTLTTRIPARKLAAVAGAICAFAYVLLAGAEVPAVRTLLMLLVAAAGLWLGRPGTASLTWLWSLVAVLLWDPWATLAPGFWLSFGAVGLLLYAGSGRLARPLARGLRARLVTALHEGARAQWVVTMGLVPGTLALFQQVAIASALANAVAIPVITLGVVPLALFAIVVPVDLPWRVAHAILAGLMRYLEWLAALPSAAWSSHAPRGWTVVIAVGGVLWLFAPRGMPGRPLGVVWMLPTALLLPPGTSEGGVRITVLDVGQGLAVFVATARHALVYDTGPRFNEAIDAGGRIVVPFLRAAGVARLDALIVSHADSDHAGGARSILNAVPVARFVSSLPGDHVLFTDAPRDMPAARCNTDMRWQWDGVRFALLHPLPSNYDEPQRKGNDLSCVLRIESLGGNVLLTGDIEALTETELLERDARGLAADVLVVPHHGSKTSSTPAFIAAVAPRVAIVAAGYRNRFGHPRGEILARYLRAGAARPRTDLQGAITVTLEPGRALAVEAERDRHRRYWYDIAP
jgi:competence protein ComEC